MKGLAEKIQKIRGELDLTDEVRLGDLRLQMGILRALEEAKATQYAQKNGSGDDKGMFLWYLKLGILSMSVRAIDDLDLSKLRPGDSVPGEKTSRFDFVLAILKEFPGDVVDHLYVVYSGLVARATTRAEKTMKLPEIPEPPKVEAPPTPPADLPTEVREGDDEGSFKDAE